MRTSHSSHRRAFTMMEVAAALGIFSFCFVAVLGLMPVALDAYRTSIETTHKARILQTVRARLLNEPYSTLPGRMVYGFDEEGADPADSGGSVRYEVEATIGKGTALTGGVLASVATVRIEITNTATRAVSHDALHLSDNGF